MNYRVELTYPDLTNNVCYASTSNQEIATDPWPPKRGYTNAKDTV